jgi:signal transduction histidine kinase
MRRLAPRSWLRLPRRTARLRLTLLYSGMFLGLGTALIVGTYLLSSSTDSIQATAVVAPGPNGTKVLEGPAPPGGMVDGSRRVLKGLLANGVNQQHSADIRRLLGTSWALLVVTAIVSALLGWFASGRVLRPLRQMTETARTISAGNLSRRLALTGPDDEFKRLGDTLDDLLARLEASFDAQRRFVANASHELRTPLTVERTLLQVALADPDASEASLRAVCEEILACGADHERLLESLLTLTSSERELSHRQPLDLARLARHVLLTPRPELQRNGLQLTTDFEPAPIAGDPALVERLVANLVDNAVHYNQRDGTVDIRTFESNGHALLSIANSGPVVRQEETERMFEPFQRLGGGRAARADGHHGLGLSIVRAIATAHDAAVAAAPRPDGGLAVTVTFPRRARSGADQSP